MDVLRSCYTVNMQFDQAGENVKPVRWYFCKPGAQTLPYSHLYGSTNWLTLPRQSVGIGERWDSPRTYSNGKPPPGAPGTRGPCGPQDWWENGVPSDAPPLQLDTNLLGACCTGDTGGILVGGGRFVPCIPLVIQDTVEAKVGDDVGFTVMDQVSPAVWLYVYQPEIVVRALGRGHAPFGNCLNAVQVDYQPFGLLISRLANRMSWNKLTGISTWVVPPGLPSSPIDNLIVMIKIDHTLEIVTGGIRVGATSKLNREFKPGTGGIRVGGTSAMMDRFITTGGLLVGASSAREERFAITGTGGVKLGATTTRATRLHGTGGVKLGATSSRKLRSTNTGGVKLGATSVVTSGIAVLCCPHRVFPTTLFATNGSAHKFTATWDATNHWWAWIDTDVPHGFHLQCTLVVSTWTWQIRPAAQPGCSSSSAASSVTCGPPMSLSITCTVTGGSCVITGAYPYTITEV